jgi:hypothetical protein
MAKKLLYEETVIKGRKPRWPYDNTLSTAQRYSTVIAHIKSEKPNYTFSGWQVSGSSTVYQEPFNDENANPFPTFTTDGEINAVWSRVENVNVMCVPSSNTVSSDGDTITLTYYAIVGDNIVTDGVTLNVKSGDTTVSYTMGQDSVTPNGIIRNVTINSNSTEDSKQLVAYATYNGQNSEDTVVYQAAQDEQIIPDCDYFLFTYRWGADDGVDLDSLTVIYVQDQNGNYVDKSFTGIPVGFRHMIPTNRPDAKNYIVYQDDDDENGLLCMKHGGDNITSGDEGAIICLSNLVNTGEIHNGEKIIVKIYANWYKTKGNGDMNIDCKAYKRISGTPNFNEDINQEGYAFLPTSTCSTVWQTQEEEYNVKAEGRLNPMFEDNFAVVPTNLDNLYSHICTITYDVKTGSKTYKPRTTDNGREARYYDGRYEYMFIYNSTGYTDYIKTFPSTTTNVVIDGLYCYYYEQENMGYLETNDDKLYMSIWIGSKKNFTQVFTKDDIGVQFNDFDDEGFVRGLKLTKYNEGGINKLRININLAENNTVAKLTIRFSFTKCPDDGRPGVCLPSPDVDNDIYTTENRGFLQIIQNARN